MVIAKYLYSLWDDLEKFDLGHSAARPAQWKGRNALYLEKMNSAIFLRDEMNFKSYRLQAEVAIPEEVGFIGLIFGAKDSANYELVYLAPNEIQYDPIMNGSMTWQIYNGPLYQKPLPNTTGVWHKFAVEVQPDEAAVYFGDCTAPQLVISNLQHGEAVGKVGVWSYWHSYIRNLSIEEIQPSTSTKRRTDFNRLKSETFITEWLVSEPFKNNRPDEMNWTKVLVEENGTLNINRIYQAEPGISVEVKSKLTFMEEKETLLSLGFSDCIRLWINDGEVYQGNWIWSPPASDGRIRPTFANVPVKWKAGENIIRAEILQTECFGWGLTVKTNMTYQ